MGEQSGEPEVTDAVELISDGENLLVLGENRHSVQRFLRSKGLLDKARKVGRHQIVLALRTSADLVNAASDAVTETGLWLKITPESAEAIKEYGLTDSGVPGIAYAMAGARGSIKEWVKVDTTAKARLANPGILSGAASALSQAARQQEAAQIRELLESLGQRLDQVIRGQRDDILGDLSGIERQIRVTMIREELEGETDAYAWSALFSTSIELRQIQAKALLKLQGIAEDLEAQRRVDDLNQQLQEARGEVRLWLSVVARCMTALDELAILELDYCAVRESHRLDARRATLDRERQDDRFEVEKGLAGLLKHMDAAATTANQNRLFHLRGVPKALDSIDETRSLVKRIYRAFGMEVDWASINPVQWRDAIWQVQQWKNGLQEGGSLAWEKGKPVLGTLAVGALMTGVTALVKEKIEPRSNLEG